MEHMASKGVTVSAVHQRNDIHSCVARFSCLLPKVSHPYPYAYPNPNPFPYHCPETYPEPYPYPYPYPYP